MVLWSYMKQTWKKILIVGILAAGLVAVWYVGGGLTRPSSETENQPSTEGGALPSPEERNIEETTETTPTASPLPKPAQSQTKPAQQSVASTGRVVFAITDDTVPIANVDSVFITLQNMSAHSPTKGWVTLNNDLRTYDLLKLKREGKLEFMFDGIIPEGTYTQLRFTVSSVVLTLNGIGQTAKLPSNTVIVPIQFSAKNKQISAVTLDFTADKAIHITNANQYIFAPVIKINTLGEIQTVQRSGSKVEFFGGYPKFASTKGMNEEGIMTNNAPGIDSLSTIEIERNIFVIVPHSIARSSLSVSPSAAMDAAIQGGYVAQVTSIHAVILDKKPSWRISGISSGRSVNIYVDGATGVVIKIE